MKMGIALFARCRCLAGAIAADFTGYVIDQSCAGKPAMKGNEACARKRSKGLGRSVG